MLYEQLAQHGRGEPVGQESTAPASRSSIYMR